MNQIKTTLENDYVTVFCFLSCFVFTLKNEQKQFNMQIINNLLNLLNVKLDFRWKQLLVLCASCTVYLLILKSLIMSPFKQRHTWEKHGFVGWALILLWIVQIQYLHNHVWQCQPACLNFGLYCLVYLILKKHRKVSFDSSLSNE